MEKQKWKKMEKRLLENSLFLMEVFEKDNSVIVFVFFLFLLFVVAKAEERKRSNGLV